MWLKGFYTDDVFIGVKVLHYMRHNTGGHVTSENVVLRVDRGGD